MTAGKKYRLSIFALLVIVTVCAAGCGSRKPDPVRADTCFIYTDGLLDDLAGRPLSACTAYIICRLVILVNAIACRC